MKFCWINAAAISADQQGKQEVDQWYGEVIPNMLGPVRGRQQEGLQDGDHRGLSRNDSPREDRVQYNLSSIFGEIGFHRTNEFFW